MSQRETGLKRLVRDAKTYYPLLLNLAGKDFKLKYRRSVLGVLWSILNPLLMMLVITSVFGLLLKVQVENFATYYIVGVALWNFFSESTNLAMGSVLSGAPLIKKVYLPKYVFPLEKCLFALINFAFSLIAVLAVMVIEGVYPTWTTLLFFLPVFYCLLFSVGLSLILSALTVYFRDIMHFYGVLLTIWMYLTPIIYPASLLESAPWAKTLVSLNPMAHFVAYFRDVMMYASVPGLKENAVCLAFGVISLVLGSLIFAKAEKKFILHI